MLPGPGRRSGVSQAGGGTRPVQEGTSPPRSTSAFEGSEVQESKFGILTVSAFGYIFSGQVTSAPGFKG